MNRGEAETKQETLKLDAEKVFITMGREPVLDILNLEATDVKVHEQGFIPTSNRTYINFCIYSQLIISRANQCLPIKVVWKEKSPRK